MPSAELVNKVMAEIKTMPETIPGWSAARLAVQLLEFQQEEIAYLRAELGPHPVRPTEAFDPSAPDAINKALRWVVPLLDRNASIECVSNNQPPEIEILHQEGYLVPDPTVRRYIERQPLSHPGQIGVIGSTCHLMITYKVTMRFVAAIARLVADQVKP